MEKKNKSEELKSELKSSAEHYKKKLENDLNQSVGELRRIGKISLFVGGAVLLGYTLSQYFFKKDRSKETIHEEGKSLSRILIDTLVSTGTEIAAIYVLNFAKGKLADYIKDLNKMKKTDQ